MKKVFVVMLSLCILSLAACTRQGNTNLGNDNKNAESTGQPTTAVTLPDDDKADITTPPEEGKTDVTAPEEGKADITTPPEEGKTDITAPEDGKADVTTPPEEDNSAIQLATRKAYIGVLNDFLNNNKLPEVELFDAGHEYDGSSDRFAVLDLNGDGVDELLVRYMPEVMAGMLEIIYGYDPETGLVYSEFTEAPFNTFYNTGLIMSRDSHNHSPAGDDYWPYSIYQYQDDTKKYNFIAGVSAWEKAYQETSNGEAFPDEADTSNTGVVYYIRKQVEWEQGEPVSSVEYENWAKQYFDGARELDIPYLPVTEENIKQLEN